MEKSCKKSVAAIVKSVESPESGAGALLNVLHAVTAEFGYIPKENIPEIAEALNLSHAEVYGVITFYKDFRTTPPALHSIRVCQAESCTAMGAGALNDFLKARLGIKPGEKTPDNRFSLDTVYCFGNCACSPTVMIDGRLYGRVDVKMLKELLDAIED